MYKPVKFFLITASCVLVGAVSIFIGHYAVSNKEIDNHANLASYAGPTDAPAAGNSSSSHELNTLSTATDRDDALAVDEIQRITPSTKMIYEYYFSEDGRIERTEEEPPYFFIDLTKEKLETNFPAWNVMEFSDRQVVMRKNIVGTSNQRYTLGVKDGFIAVFYKEPINGDYLKELTDTPVIALSQEEQHQLQAGIEISGDDELMKILEDYGS